MTPQQIRPLLKGASGPEDQFTAQCPAHGDKNASLSVGLGDKGGTVLHCHAGCPTDKIVAAMGLTMKDLFSDKPQAPAKPLRPNDKDPEAEYIYTDECGTVIHKTIRYGKKRFSQARPDPNKPGRWIYSLNGIETVLYRLPEVSRSLAE